MQNMVLRAWPSVSLGFRVSRLLLRVRGCLLAHAFVSCRTGFKDLELSSPLRVCRAGSSRVVRA